MTTSALPTTDIRKIQAFAKHLADDAEFMAMLAQRMEGWHLSSCGQGVYVFKAEFNAYGYERMPQNIRVFGENQADAESKALTVFDEPFAVLTLLAFERREQEPSNAGMQHGSLVCSTNDIEQALAFAASEIEHLHGSDDQIDTILEFRRIEVLLRKLDRLEAECRADGVPEEPDRP